MPACHVYIDRKPPTTVNPLGEPFYVGVGGNTRVAKKSRENIWHTNICTKYPEWTRTIIETSDRELCLELESFLVSEIGRRYNRSGTLVNSTGGGDNNPALDPEVKVKMSQSAKRRVLSGVHHFTTNPPMRKIEHVQKMKKSHQSRLLNGTHHLLVNNPSKRESTIEARRLQFTNNNPMKNPEVVSRRVNPSHIPEVAKRRGDMLRGRICVNNGVKYIRVKPEDVDSYLNDGWVKGRLCPQQ